MITQSKGADADADADAAADADIPIIYAHDESDPSCRHPKSQHRDE